jgi:hypothetical protein
MELVVVLLPLHVSALVGHLQTEYTIILGSYLTHNCVFCIPPEDGQQGPKHLAAENIK